MEEIQSPLIFLPAEGIHSSWWPTAITGIFLTFWKRKAS